MVKLSAKRRVHLFRNGRNQAIRIPREFELPGDEAILCKDAAGRLIIEPIRPTTLVALLSTWTPLAEADAMPEIPDLPAEIVNL